MKPAQSFVGKAGTVAITVVKHVPARGLLWGMVGLVAGTVGVILSYVLGVVMMDRGALVLGYLVSIPIAIPGLGMVLFGMHGLHRGAARAALVLDEKFGLVSYLVDRVLSQADERFGEGLRNLPMQQLELALKQSVATYLSSGSDEDKGLVGYVVRRARNALVPRIETYLLSAYREEQKVDGSGGGVSLERVRERALKAISERLAEIVMSPLNKQLAIFMTLYLLLAVGWWFWLFLLIGALSKVSGH